MESKQQLKLVFQYYCAFGDRYNFSNLKSAKFQKLLLDAGITPKLFSIKSGDILYMKQSKNTQNMDLQHFQEMLVQIAAEAYPGQTPQESLNQLFKHITALYDNISQSTNFGEQQKILDAPIGKHFQLVLPAIEKQLLLVHHFIFPDQAKEQNKVQSQYYQFLNQFDVQPTFINQIQSFILFDKLLSVYKPKNNYILTPQAFNDSLIKIAILSAKVHTERGEIESFRDILNSIESSDGYAKFQAQSNRTNSELRQMVAQVEKVLIQFDDPKQTQQQPKEESKNASPQLKQIFEFYAKIGDPLNNQSLKSSKFVRLLQDAKIIDLKYTITDADMIYVKVTKNVGKMNFQQFVQAVESIGADKVQQVVENCTMSLQEGDDRSSQILEILGELQGDPRIADFSPYLSPQLDMYFRNHSDKDKMSAVHFNKFCQDFEISDTLSQPQLLKIFQTVVGLKSRDFMDTQSFNQSVCLLGAIIFTTESDNLMRIILIMEKLNDSQGAAKVQMATGSTRPPKAYSMEIIDQLNKKHNVKPGQRISQKKDVNQMFQNIS